jgi:hypothetical protein
MRTQFLWTTFVGRKHSSWITGIFLAAFVAVSGCTATPDKPNTPGVLFRQSAAATQKAAVDALVVTGFDIQKSEPLYVEGSRPHKIGLFVGSGGETVGVWLEPVESTITRVRVDTAKSVVGIVGQKNWDDAVLEEMEKTLGKRQ